MCNYSLQKSILCDINLFTSHINGPKAQIINRNRFKTFKFHHTMSLIGLKVQALKNETCSSQFCGLTILAQKMDQVCMIYYQRTLLKVTKLFKRNKKQGYGWISLWASIKFL